MNWTRGWGIGFAIFAYVLIATVWLPDFVLSLGPIASGSALVRDVVVLAVWGGALGAGMWVLRRAQERGML